MLRIRSRSLLSGASVIAIVTGLAAGGSAQAGQTVSGPLVQFNPIIDSTNSDFVTINLAATVKAADGTNATSTDLDSHNDSFFNGKTKTFAGNNLLIDDSFLVGDVEIGFNMTATGANDSILIQNDAHVDGRLFNAATILGGNNGISLVTDSTIADGVFNKGTITGTAVDGIQVGATSEILGGVHNFTATSLIQGGRNGIGITGAQADFDGGITNAGTIQALGTTPGAAILFSGDQFWGGITNTKLIQGLVGADGILTTAGTFNGGVDNSASGTIIGTGAAFAAIRMTGGIFADNIVNSGLFSGLAGANGIEMNGVTMNGDITNNSTGTIQVAGGAATDILLTGASTMNGSISNSGQMLALVAGGHGINMSGAATFTGSVTNQSSALINASGVAILTTNASFIGNMTNDGSINSANSDAIREHSTIFTGDLTNNGTGNITGHFDGFDIGGTTFTGNVWNRGHLTGTVGSGMDISVTTLTGSVHNSGSLTAGTIGINVRTGVTVSENVINETDGHIVAGNTGIVVAGTVTGSVINNGLIDPAIGISVLGTVSDIFNTGSILATTTGIDLRNELGTTTVSQTAGLLRGNAVEDGSGAIADALNMNNAHANTFNFNGGVLDGNVVANNTDNMKIIPLETTAAWLRGTANALNDFNTGGERGTQILGAASRGDASGIGVTVNANQMLVDTGTTYLDDDTRINLVNGYTNHNGVTEFYLTSTEANHAIIAAGTTIDTDAANIAAFVDGTTFGALGGNVFHYLGVMTGTTNGTTDDIETNSLFFEAQAIFNANTVDIDLTRLSFADALVLPGMTQNETTIANALDNIYALGPIGPGGYGPDFTILFNYLLSLGVGDEAAALFVYNELAGAQHAQLQQTTLDILNPFNTFMGQRLDDAMANANGAGFAHNPLRQDYAMLAGMMSDANPGLVRGDSGVSLWGRGYGQTLKVDGDPEAPGYDQDTGGAVGGIDVTVGHDALLGFALGWANTDVDFNTPGDSANVDSLQVGAYGSWVFGHGYFDGEVAGAFHDLSTTRLLNLPPAAGGGMVAGADFSARSLSASGEIGGVWRAGNWLFQPNAGVLFTDVNTNSFVESGAGDFNLIVGDSDATSLASNVGLRLAALFNAGHTPIMPELSASWRHEFDDDRQAFSAAFPDDPASTFTIISSKISADSAVIGAGVTAGVGRNVEFFVNYNGLINSDVTVANGSAGLRATW